MTLLSTEKLQATGAAAPVDPEQAESVRAIKTAIREQMISENLSATPAAATPPVKVTPAPKAEKPSH